MCTLRCVRARVCVRGHVSVRACKCRGMCVHAHVEHVQEECVLPGWRREPLHVQTCVHMGVRCGDTPGCPPSSCAGPPGILTWGRGCRRDRIAGNQVQGAPTGPRPSRGDTGRGTGSALSRGHEGCRGAAAALPAGRRSAGRKRGRYRAAGCGPGSAAASGPKFPGVTITAVPSWALPSPPRGAEQAGDAASC